MVFFNVNQKTTCLMIKIVVSVKFIFTTAVHYQTLYFPLKIQSTRCFYFTYHTIQCHPSVCSVKHSVHLVYCILYLRYCIHQHLYIILYRCRVGPYLFHNYSICVLVLFRLYCCVVKQIMYSVNSLELRSCFSCAEVFK